MNKHTLIASLKVGFFKECYSYHSISRGGKGDIPGA